MEVQITKAIKATSTFIRNIDVQMQHGYDCYTPMYNITLTKNHETEDFIYYDSIANYQKNNKKYHKQFLTEAGIRQAVGMIIEDAQVSENSFEDFIEEFYGTVDGKELKKAKSIYEGCKQTALKLKKLNINYIDFFEQDIEDI